MLPLKMVKYSSEIKNKDLHDLFVLETLLWINLCPEEN